MAVIKKYNLSGEEVGEFAVDDKLLKDKTNMQMIKDYIVAIRANARQWSASTLGRSDVNHTKAKPHPQKGTGRARQGRLSSPQYKGGGRVHCPRPKFDQHVSINKKEKQAAVSQLIADRIRGNSLHILVDAFMETPKTKTISQFLDKRDLAGERVLFLGSDTFENRKNFHLSLRNIPALQSQAVSTVNGYDLALHENIIVLEPAMEQFLAILERGCKK